MNNCVNFKMIYWVFLKLIIERIFSLIVQINCVGNSLIKKITYCNMFLRVCKVYVKVWISFVAK